MLARFVMKAHYCIFPVDSVTTIRGSNSSQLAQLGFADHVMVSYTFQYGRLGLDIQMRTDGRPLVCCLKGWGALRWQAIINSQLRYSLKSRNSDLYLGCSDAPKYYHWTQRLRSSKNVGL